MHGQRRRHLEAAQTAREELASTPGWRRGRRHDLHHAIAVHQAGFEQTFPEAARLDRAIDTLARQVRLDTQQREQEQRQRSARTVPARANQDAYLAPAATTGGLPRPGARRRLASADVIEPERARIDEAHRRRTHYHDHTSGRGRDDGRAMGI